jgi:hypothetical protein
VRPRPPGGELRRAGAKYLLGGHRYVAGGKGRLLTVQFSRFHAMTPGTPELDEGTVAFYRTFFEETNEVTNQVFEVVTIDAEGALTTVADTRGEFASFGFRPPR